mgnify:CR=1 FL=1
MPDISILVDIADYYDISIPEIISGERKSEMMNEEERKIAKTMSDYATTEKEKIFKEMKLQSVMGVCALVLYWILHETGAYMYNDVLGKLAGYCETLVSVSVIMMAAFTTGSLSKVRSKSRKVFAFENFPKPMQLVVTAVVAFGELPLLQLLRVACRLDVGQRGQMGAVMTGGSGVGAVGYLLEKNLPGGGFRPGVAQGVEARWVA